MHIISWKKFGILTPVLFLAGAVASQWVLKLLARDYGRWQSANIFVPGLLLVVVGHALDRKKQANTFCHFPMIVWGGLAFVFGAVILFAG